MGLFRRIQPYFGGGTFSGGRASEIGIRWGEKPQADISVLWRGTQSGSHSRNVYHHEPWLRWKNGVAGKFENSI